MSPERVEYWLARHPDEMQQAPLADLARYEAAHELHTAEPSAGEMSGFDVLHWVSVCARCGLAMPEWLSRAYLRRYDAVLNLRAGSWDDPAAFGRPYKKGANLTAMRKRRRLRFAVLAQITMVRWQEPDTPIDENLFERVGKEFNVGKTLCAELYYEAIRHDALPFHKRR